MSIPYGNINFNIGSQSLTHNDHSPRIGVGGWGSGGGSYGLVTWRDLGLLGVDGGSWSPRLKWARSWAVNRGFLDEEGRLKVVKLWDEWRRYDEFIVLVRRDLTDGGIKEAVAVKCAKRGNDVYNWRLKMRLRSLSGLIDRFGDMRVLDRENYTRVLLITLTYDPKRSDVGDGWLGVGVEYNRWISGLRRRFGRISAFRVWEAFGNGYPHIHVLMVFHDHRFKTFIHQGNDGKTSLRVENKGDFSANWHSFVDVQSPYTLKAACRYVVKYLSKVHEGEDPPMGIMADGVAADGGISKGSLTMALMWVFRKRAFSISGDLLKQLSDLIRVKHNSNMGMGVQVDLGGDPVEVWEVLRVDLGDRIRFFCGDDVKWDGRSWYFEVDPCIL